MARLEKIYQGLIQFLREKVHDPIERGANWIFPDYPREDATMPRISVLQTGATRTDIQIGGGGWRFVHVFEIGIWTNSRAEMTYQGIKYKGSRLREWLADQVLDAFVSYKSQAISMIDGSVRDIIVSSTRTSPYIPTMDVYGKTLTVEVQHEEFPHSREVTSNARISL